MLKTLLVSLPAILGAIVVWLIILVEGDLLVFMPFFIGGCLVSMCCVFAIQPSRQHQQDETLLDDEMLCNNKLNLFRDKLMED